jgi:hypothetical protein
MQGCFALLFDFINLSIEKLDLLVKFSLLLLIGLYFLVTEPLL